MCCHINLWGTLSKNGNRVAVLRLLRGRIGINLMHRFNLR
ncbi:hypothetical protein WP5S18E01_33950 [Enterobacter cloacae]|nr:hypothetical protein WP5S18E01_33950 [Enterobacter cloacae]